MVVATNAFTKVTPTKIAARARMSMAARQNDFNKIVGSVGLASALFFQSSMPSFGAELPALDKCFNAVRKELGPEGDSLKRLKADIDSENWDDIVIFTREYDAGFRGGVLKSAWKQLGDTKMQGIQLSNSFTFDLIGLNKAARGKDKTEAYASLEKVKQDLVNFIALDPTAK
jgi:hypothetical protein